MHMKLKLRTLLSIKQTASNMTIYFREATILDRFTSDSCEPYNSTEG